MKLEGITLVGGLGLQQLSNPESNFDYQPSQVNTLLLCHSDRLRVIRDREVYRKLSELVREVLKGE